MPYFKNDKNNLLFIHIPKTGGSSVENYFSKKYNIPLNNNSLFGENKLYTENTFYATLQHILYKTILKNKKLFKINEDKLQILSIVRNPYNKIISDLFYNNYINKFSTKEYVFKALQKFINIDSRVVDNHNLPQYLFIQNNGIIDSRIKILHTETLTKDMINLGYTDFNIITNKNKDNINDYYKYLNNDSIKLINFYYSKDFELFNYNKIIPDK
jgi:hypothetical protein